jgi:hypothetical protein
VLVLRTEINCIMLWDYGEGSSSEAAVGTNTSGGSALATFTIAQRS